MTWDTTPDGRGRVRREKGGRKGRERENGNGRAVKEEDEERERGGDRRGEMKRKK